MRRFRSEAAAVAWFARSCRDQGAFVQKLQLRYTVGFPDLLVVWKEWVFFYEVKQLGRSADALQWLTLKRLDADRRRAFVVEFVSPELARITGVDDVTRWVRPASPDLWVCPLVRFQGATALAAGTAAAPAAPRGKRARPGSTSPPAAP